MRTIQVELPDRLAEQVEHLVQLGWFRNADDLIARAIADYAQQNRLELEQRFQMEDVAWAENLAAPPRA